MITMAYQFLDWRKYHLSLRSCTYLVVLLSLLLSSSGFAQDQSSSPIDRIQWTVGPARVSLGGVAHLNVPDGYRFTDSAGARLWEEATKNPPEDAILGILIPPLDIASDPQRVWSASFFYEDTGHVSDDEKASFDKDAVAAILDSITKATEEGNIQRASRGWPALNIVGWQQQPFYDEQTHHLSWAVAASGNGSNTVDTVNYNSRVLGRTGVMSVKLVVSPSALAEALPSYQTVVSGISFNVGNGYAEFRPGDKVAKYGLIALITGGAAVVAVKSWGVLVKIGAVFLAMVAAGLAKAASKVKLLFRSASPKPATAGAKESAAPESAAAVIKCPVCGQANRVRSNAGTGPARCGRCNGSLTK